MKSALALAACLFTSVAAQAVTVRLDAGGGGSGAYAADRLYSTANGGGAIGGEVSTPRLVENGQVIENTTEIALLNSVREGMSEYRFDLPDGHYLLTLQFVELYANGPNLRRFSIVAENITVLADLDLYARFGRNYAVTYRFATEVADGQLNVRFPASIGVPTVSAVAVQTMERDAVPPAMPRRVAALDGYYRNIITWPDQSEPDLAGYVVARASTAWGGYLVITPGLMPASRWFDDGVAPFTTAYYRVAAMDVFGNRSAFGPPVAAAPRDRTLSTLPVYQLAIAPDQYALLQADPAHDYVRASFTHEGVAYPDIGARFRGASSLRNHKKSWKLNFKGSQPFQGRDKLNQKASSIDLGMLSECLVQSQLAPLNLLTAGCSFSHLEVNGEYMGVFQQLEEVDEDYLASKGLHPEGALVEGEYPPYANFRVLDDYAQGWDDQSANGDSFPAFAAFVRTLNETPQASFAPTIASILHVDAWLDFYATIVLNGDWDHVVHNYYMYKSPESPLWEVIPKDFDQAYLTPTMTLLQGVKTVPPPPGGFNVLTTRLMSVPLYRQWYVDKLNALLAGSFTPAAMGQRIDTLHALIEADGRRDVYKKTREDNAAFDASVANLKTFVDRRIAYVQANIASISPGLALPVVINEVQPDNRTGPVTGAGRHSPWIELHNRSGAPYDLSGHHLSNDPLQPAMWAFPAGTVLPAGGHRIVWLDNLPAPGELHANFGLSTRGQAVALFAPGGALLDVAAYRPMAPDAVLARRGSGGALWAVGSATPAAPNPP